MRVFIDTNVLSVATVPESTYSVIIDALIEAYIIHSGPDDNKFVDCAIAAGTDFNITEDKHLKVLADVDFPGVNFIRAIDFIDKYLK